MGTCAAVGWAWASFYSVWLSCHLPPAFSASLSPLSVSSLWTTGEKAHGKGVRVTGRSETCQLQFPKVTVDISKKLVLCFKQSKRLTGHKKKCVCRDRPLAVTNLKIVNVFWKCSTICLSLLHLYWPMISWHQVRIVQTQPAGLLAPWKGWQL